VRAALSSRFKFREEHFDHVIFFQNWVVPLEFEMQPEGLEVFHLLFKTPKALALLQVSFEQVSYAPLPGLHYSLIEVGSFLLKRRKEPKGLTFGQVQESRRRLEVRLHLEHDFE